MEKGFNEVMNILLESRHVLKQLNNEKYRPLESLHKTVSYKTLTDNFNILEEKGLVEKGENSTGYRLTGRGVAAVKRIKELENICKIENK